MPRPKPDVETVPVYLRIHPDVLAVIDKLRGDASRAAWIMACVGRDLGERSERAAGVMVARKAAKVEPPAVVQVVTAAVQFGPTKADPGSRLKGTKK